MSKNFKKMLSYYKPYRCIFWADMFFATVSAAVALAIPLVIRYVTYTLVYEDKAQIMFQIKIIAAALFAMVAADCYSKFFISNYGHVMGAKIEYNMRAEIFEHLQKLSFSFYDSPPPPLPSRCFSVDITFNRAYFPFTRSDCPPQPPPWGGKQPN